MASINFKKIIEEYSDDSYSEFRHQSLLYMPYIFNDENDGTKAVEEEKLASYLVDLELKTNMRDSDLAKVYTHALMSLMNKVVKKSNKEAAKSLNEKYLERVSAIDKQISDRKNNKDVLEYLDLCQLEDITKVFLCLYSKYLEHTDQYAGNMNFSMKGIDLNKIIEALNNTDIQQIKLQDTLGDAINKVLPQQAKDVAENVNGFAQRLADAVNKSKQKDKRIEPIHDVIEVTAGINIYSKERYVQLMLMMMYYRIIDSEKMVEE